MTISNFLNLDDEIQGIEDDSRHTLDEEEILEDVIGAYLEPNQLKMMTKITGGILSIL